MWKIVIQSLSYGCKDIAENFKQSSFLCVLLFFQTGLTVSQKISYSLPEIKNFNRFEYNGGTQTWDICSITQNRIAAANNEGLLIFNGHNWDKYSLPNHTILRSIAFDPKNEKIFVGGQDELGYFQADEQGKLIYTDLKQSIPDAFSQLEDVWNLKFVQGHLYFRSLDKIYNYDGRQWKVVFTKKSTQLIQIENTILYHDIEKGLFKIVDGHSTFIEGSELIKNKTLTSIIALKNQWFVFTEKDGMFLYYQNRWQTIPSNENDFLKTNRVHAACKINDSLMAIGTYLKGIILLDQNGKLKMTLAKEQGIQNNTISSLYVSANEQLWVGTYNGIDMIDLGKNLTSIFPDGSLQGSVYAAVIYDKKLYCGTENGLYFKPLDAKPSMTSNSDFQLVKNSEGQVWGLDLVLGDLIMSHNDGAFHVKENVAHKISKYNGSWKFLELEDQHYCIAGAYTGLYVFKKENNVWSEIGKVSGFDESCRIMVKENNHIWVSHPYRGLYKISVNIDKLTADIENFGQKNGLPGYLRNTVFNIESNIVVSTEIGLFKFDPMNNRFSPLQLPGIADIMKPPFKALEVYKNKLWLATDHQFGYLQFDKSIFDSKEYVTNIHELKNILVPGFEKIYPLDDSDVLLLTTRGLRCFNNVNPTKSNMEVYVSRLFDINQQKVISEGFERNHHSKKNLIKLAYHSNALLFDFATNACTNDIRYRYQLKPIQSNWTQWEYKNQKEFNNLQADTYELIVEAMDAQGNISKPFKVSFEIMAPWYKTKTAQAVYLMAIALVIFYSRRRLVKKYELITSDLKEQKSESEALVYQLQKEKLEAEILFKNKELGLTTMHLVQKNEAISKLKTELNKIVKKIGDVEAKKEIKNLVSILSEDERLEDDWHSFAQNFDAAHNDFLSRLKDHFPNLSPTDLKLCAYLKLNLSSKEIAPLLNISVRGVEISRYRLRKKLELSNDINLNEFMMGL